MRLSVPKRLPIQIHMFKRLREEAGFGLMELLMAMTMLNIGILALIAAFNSGAVAIKRAQALSTAASIADQQMEGYRAVRWASIALTSGELGADGKSGTVFSDTTYACDAVLLVNAGTACGAGNRKAQVVRSDCGTPLPRECDPVRDVTGPDNGRYRIFTYIVEEAPSGTSRAVRTVTVVVREISSGRTLIRAQSTFDTSTAS